MKIIDESERLKGEVVGVSLEEEEGIRKRKGVVNNLAEQETSRLVAIVFLYSCLIGQITLVRGQVC